MGMLEEVRLPAFSVSGEVACIALKRVGIDASAKGQCIVAQIDTERFQVDRERQIISAHNGTVKISVCEKRGRKCVSVWRAPSAKNPQQRGKIVRLPAPQDLGLGTTTDVANGYIEHIAHEA